MGFLSGSNPFDADVEKATSDTNVKEEWGAIMDVCDKVGSSSTHVKDCLKAVYKRLHNPDPHVSVQAVTLLDALVNNCGKNFHLEVASRDFEREFRHSLKYDNPAVQDKLKSLLKKWAENEFKTDAQLNLIPALYMKLRQEGVEFSDAQPTKKTQPLPKDPNVVSSQQEQDDIAKAIELSLKETSSPKFSGAGSASASLYPSAMILEKPNKASAPSSARKVRALHDFEAGEDNELTFKAGEIIHVIDDSDAHWWKGSNQRGEGLFPSVFVTTDLNATLETAKVEENRKTVQFSDVAAVVTEPTNESSTHSSINVINQAPVTEIDEAKIDRTLHLLHEANPNDDRTDTPDLRQLEYEVNLMGPLIDTELERVDRNNAQLTQLSRDIVEAFGLYHALMREPQLGTLPKIPINSGTGAFSMPNVYNSLPTVPQPGQFPQSGQQMYRYPPGPVSQQNMVAPQPGTYQSGLPNQVVNNYQTPISIPQNYNSNSPFTQTGYPGQMQMGTVPQLGNQQIGMNHGGQITLQQQQLLQQQQHLQHQQMSQQPNQNIDPMHYQSAILPRVNVNMNIPGNESNVGAHQT